MILFYLISVVIVLLDQLTKWLVVQNLGLGDTIPLIDGALHFTYVRNTGAAFGMMKDSRWVFMVVSSLAIVALVVLIARYAKEDKFTTITLAMILGGGVGNMIDRVRLGYVVDFVDFRLINFAVFNVADSFVTVGACLLIFCLIREFISESRMHSRPETGDDVPDDVVDDDGDAARDDDEADGVNADGVAGEEDHG